MSIEQLNIGGIRIWRFIHQRGRGTPGWMFPDVDPNALADHMDPYLAPDGRFEYVYSSLLVRSGPDLVLIDAGPPAPGRGAPSSVERLLGKIGVSPTAIGTVVVSHAHLDHIGGLVRSGQPAFPGARHVIDQRELAHWTSGEERSGEAARFLGPVVDAGLVDTIDAEQRLLPEMSVLPTPGHTPGHLAVIVRSEGAAVIHAGDVLAHEVNIPEPGWNHFSDMDAEAAARSRHLLVDRARQLGAAVIGSHVTTVPKLRSSGPAPSAWA